MSDEAHRDLKSILDYLQRYWTLKEIDRFWEKLDQVVALISINPLLFEAGPRIDIRKAVLNKHNMLYYTINKKTVEIITISDNQSNPNKININ